MKWIEDNLSLPRRVFYQEVAGKANPMERHPETPSHLQVDRRDGDGDRKSTRLNSTLPLHAALPIYLSLPRRVFYQEVAGKANPMERHPETPSHLQVDRRDGD